MQVWTPRKITGGLLKAGKREKKERKISAKKKRRKKALGTRRECGEHRVKSQWYWERRGKHRRAQGGRKKNTQETVRERTGV